MKKTSWGCDLGLFLGTISKGEPVCLFPCKIQSKDANQGTHTHTWVIDLFGSWCLSPGTCLHSCDTRGAFGISRTAKTCHVLGGILENPHDKQRKCKAREQVVLEMKRPMGREGGREELLDAIQDGWIETPWEYFRRGRTELVRDQ